MELLGIGFLKQGEGLPPPLFFIVAGEKWRKNTEKLAIQNLRDLSKTYVNHVVLRISTVFDDCKRVIKKVLICQLYLSRGVMIWRAVSPIRFYPAHH